MIVPKLRVRITYIDAITVTNHGSPANSELDDTTLPRVPIIRVFGQVDGGDGGAAGNACVHIHQVYPYIYVEYEGSREPHAGASNMPKPTHWKM